MRPPGAGPAPFGSGTSAGLMRSKAGPCVIAVNEW